MLVEKFVTVQIEKGNKTAVILALETLVIALIGYTVLSPTTPIGQYTINFTLAHPLALLLIIPINVFIGKWTGLRLNEYMRFHEVINKIK
jgi:ABC-type tungstate transport system substrate-binding protein